MESVNNHLKIYMLYKHKVRGHNRPGKDSKLANWMALENEKEGIHFWTFNCIKFYSFSS